MSTSTTAARPTWCLLVAPLIVVVAIALLWISNELIVLGPFDRASFGWAVPVPMLLLAPAVAGLVGGAVGGRRPLVAIVATAVALGLFVTVFLVAVTDRVGCDASVAKAGILVLVAPVGLAAGIGYGVAGGAALRIRDRPITAALAGIVLAAVSWFVALSVFALEFQGVSCAYVGS